MAGRIPIAEDPRFIWAMQSPEDVALTIQYRTPLETTVRTISPYEVEPGGGWIGAL